MKTLVVFTLSLLLTFLLVTPAFAREKSLFIQTPEQVRAAGSYDCSALEPAQKIRDVRRLCGASVADWKAFAHALIEVPKNERLGERHRLSELEQIVYKNTLITQYYAHLYLQSWNPTCGAALLPWVGGASLGSLKSGQVMRTALSNRAGGIDAFDRFEDADYRDRFARIFGIGGNFALEQATLTLGEGNREIFKDLFWQLLAGVTCGPEVVVQTIQNDPVGVSDPKLARSLQSWLLLADYVKTCDPTTLNLANKNFVEVEQYLVGQPVMYEGLAQRAGGYFLAPVIEAAVPMVLGEFPTFVDHARESLPSYKVNFADADQRVSWMKDQLGVMEQAFNANRGTITEPLFCAVTRDSEETRALLR